MKKAGLVQPGRFILLKRCEAQLSNIYRVPTAAVSTRIIYKRANAIVVNGYLSMLKWLCAT